MFSRRRLPSPIELAAAAVVSAGVMAGAWFGARSGEPEMPNPKLTPGSVFSHVTLREVQEPGYSATVRNVPWSLKVKVAANYGVNERQLRHLEAYREIEVDHLCPLSLGGDNSEANLWIQYAKGHWNYHVKDALEVHLLHAVRRGEVDLKTAQREMMTDWKASYQKRIAKAPLKAHFGSQAEPEA